MKKCSLELISCKVIKKGKQSEKLRNREPFRKKKNVMKFLGVKIIRKAYDPKVCSICTNELQGLVKTLKCKHVFCPHCIKRWFDFGNKTCPTCRAVVK